MAAIRVGMFPYGRDSANPYQDLYAAARRDAGIEVIEIPGRKILPISHALAHDIDLLHIDWPYDLYTGRNRFWTTVKRIMYEIGLRQLKRRPLVWTAHNVSAHDARDPAYDLAMTQKLIDRCDAIQVLSTASESALRETFRIPSQTLVQRIPHGHYIDAYPNTICRAEARAQLGIDGGARVVLVFGRILPYKGIDLLIDAFNSVAAAPGQLIIAGPDEDRVFLQKLRSAASASVRILPGRVPPEGLQVLFNAADVVALPFREILNSGALLLAMSFGKCVVAPRLGSVPEIAHPHSWFGYDAADPQALAKALRDAIDRDDLLERGQAAKAFAREHYDWGGIGQAAKLMYERVLCVGPTTADARPSHAC